VNNGTNVQRKLLSLLAATILDRAASSPEHFANDGNSVPGTMYPCRMRRFATSGRTAESLRRSRKMSDLLHDLRAKNYGS